MKPYKLGILITACIAFLSLLYITYPDKTGTPNESEFKSSTLDKKDAQNLKEIVQKKQQKNALQARTYSESLRSEPGLAEAEKNNNYRYESTIDTSKFITEEGMLETSNIKDVISSQQKLTILMDKLAGNYSNSLKSFENRTLYEQHLLSQSAQNEAKVNLKRLECGETVCFASISVYDKSVIVDYVKKLQSSENYPIKSNAIYPTEQGLNLAFSTGNRAGNVRLTPYQRDKK